jgi:hypothetical protein
MVPGLEIAVGYLAGWAVRKLGRATGRADRHVDATVDRFGDLIAGKLAGDRALTQLETEGAAGVANPHTTQRLLLAVEQAAETDPGFAAALHAAVADLVAADNRSAASTSGPHSVVHPGADAVAEVTELLDTAPRRSG